MDSFLVEGDKPDAYMVAHNQVADHTYLLRMAVHMVAHNLVDLVEDSN